MLTVQEVGGARALSAIKTRWSSLPLAEVIVMALVASGAVEFSRRVLGIHDTAIAMVFAVFWLRPLATALSNARRGRPLSWKGCRAQGPEAWVPLVVGSAPWVALEVLRNIDPSWAVHQSRGLPMWLRVCGAAMAVAVVLAQHGRVGPNRAAVLRSPMSDVTLVSRVAIVLMLMMTGSVFMAALTTAWLLSVRLCEFAEKGASGGGFVDAGRPVSIPLGLAAVPVERQSPSGW